MDGSAEQRYLEELKAFLRIPSVSTDPAHKPDVRHAAEFVAGQLRQTRMRNVGLIERDGCNPLVYGEWLEAPGKPTLLMYGHYDVQPPDPLDEWKSPPFDPEVRGDNIYARGAADDKGLTLILLKAVERLMQRDGRLPVNVRFLIEGEEEVGGEHIEEFVRSKDARLQADAAVICDTEMFAPELPTICVGLRGIVYGELHVQGAEADLHSGMYGGAAPNPIQAIAEILCALKDREGHILIPGFYDRVRPPSATEMEAWHRLPFDPERFRARRDEGAGHYRGTRAGRTGADVGASDARGPRHQRRLYGGGREDRDSGARRGEDQHAACAGSAARRSITSNSGMRLLPLVRKA